MHEPATQWLERPESHARPQLPQLSMLVCVLMQRLLQHDWLAVQVRLHAPQ